VSPSYAGAIGNNGNTILFNGSFDPAQLWHRGIFFGVRANAIGDLAGGLAFNGAGDLDGNNLVNLADAIIAMKVLSGLTPTVRGDYVTSGVDLNNDGRIGLQELLYILQYVAGLRP
jgi:hypothetical protein